MKKKKQKGKKMISDQAKEAREVVCCVPGHEARAPQLLTMGCYPLACHFPKNIIRVACPWLDAHAALFFIDCAATAAFRHRNTTIHPVFWQQYVHV